MSFNDIDKKLKSLTYIEEEFIYKTRNTLSDYSIFELKSHYSTTNKHDFWLINNSKIMMDNEIVSIRKHDRFVKFPKHKHDFIEIMFVYSGTIKQQINRHNITINKGEILLLDMNVQHSIETANENDIAINILLKKEFFDWMFMKELSHNDIISSFIINSLYDKEKFKQYLHFKTSHNTKVWCFMMEILNEYYHHKIGMETAIRSYLLLLFNELLRDYEKSLSNKIVDKIESTISVEILNYVNNNFNDITLKSLSDHFKYNPDYLGKLIKKITGKTLTTLIKERRLIQAEYLLSTTDVPVMDIISEIGYSNATYFYKQFKEEFGVTPDEYRKKL